MGSATVVRRTVTRVDRMLGVIRLQQPLLDRRRIIIMVSIERIELRVGGRGVRGERVLSGEEPVSGD